MTGDSRTLSRRSLLVAAAGSGAALAGGGLAAAVPAAAIGPPPAADAVHGDEAVPFFGPHQAGVTAAAQAHEVLIALDLRPATDRDGLRRMMRLLSDDAARLAAGRAALADIEPELAEAPSRLAFGFGFGPALVARAGGEVPAWLAPLPSFGIDRLDPAVCDGDLLVQVCGDDPLTIAHAARMLLKDSARYATVRWTQRGFRRARGTVPEGTTMRNLFGQVDGTAGPHPGEADFDSLVWIPDGWLAGGTSLVVRRIAMDLEGWDQLGRADREHAVGRRLDTGAPVTGQQEQDEPDLAAADSLGFPVIKPWAHLRRARTENPRERIYRRSFNYDDGPLAAEDTGAGLVFLAYQADPLAQFVPIQRRLDELDLLNIWTTPVGSAVFAYPPGCQPGGYVGETLLD